MTDVPPDRLSVDPSSPFYDEAALARGIGVKFRGVERRDVEEYCVSEGWIRAAAGKALDRRGQPLVIKMTGAVEPYFLSPAGEAAIKVRTDGPARLAAWISTSNSTFATRSPALLASGGTARRQMNRTRSNRRASV